MIEEYGPDAKHTWLCEGDGCDARYCPRGFEHHGATVWASGSGSRERVNRQARKHHDESGHPVRIKTQTRREKVIS